MCKLCTAQACLVERRRCALRSKLSMLVWTVFAYRKEHIFLCTNWSSSHQALSIQRGYLSVNYKAVPCLLVAARRSPGPQQSQQPLPGHTQRDTRCCLCGLHHSGPRVLVLAWPLSFSSSGPCQPRSGQTCVLLSSVKVQQGPMPHNCPPGTWSCLPAWPGLAVDPSRERDDGSRRCQ